MFKQSQVNFIYRLLFTRHCHKALEKTASRALMSMREKPLRFVVNKKSASNPSCHAMMFQSHLQVTTCVLERLIAWMLTDVVLVSMTVTSKLNKDQRSAAWDRKQPHHYCHQHSALNSLPTCITCAGCVHHDKVLPVKHWSQVRLVLQCRKNKLKKNWALKLALRESLTGAVLR